MDPNRVIDKLGGTAAVANLCEVSQPAVSYWRREGIPGYRMAFLRLARPALFAELEAEIEAEKVAMAIPWAGIH